MTPEPRDLLRGALATLEEVVLPALGDAFAIEQTRTVLRVLAHLDAVIDDAYTLEWQEASDLAALLGEPAQAVDEPPSYRALREANVARKRALVEAIRGTGADDVRIQAYVQRQTDRERRWTSPKRVAP